MSTDNAPMQVDEDAIDEGLYSRQLYVLGHDAMKKMAISNVLILGAQGLGVEIAKNVCLAGVKSVTIYDPEPVTLEDLGTQFFLREQDIGRSRAEVTAPRLAELNAYVPVKVLDGKPGQFISVEALSAFKAVVATNLSWKQQQVINAWTHKNGVAFIAAETRGLFGCVFNDFGPEFTCIDPTGEEALSGMIVSVSKDSEGLVTCLDETRHGLEDGDFVTFSEVKGPYTFTIGDTSGLGDYQSGGIFTQVKMPKTLSFKPLSESLVDPEYFITDFAKFDRLAALHYGFQALSAFRDKHGRLPAPRSSVDADEVLAIAKGLTKEELSEDIVRELAFQAKGDVSPMNAVIGGFVAQEVIKACSAKFHPMKQHMYFDSLESLPASKPTEADCQPLKTRYDGQIAVFGRTFHETIANHKQFLVGSGAIGCEMLKNWAMMGVGTGPNGKIHVTDLDTIEKSNLNRQFLFRPKDIGKFKSEAAAQAVTDMNPDMRGHVNCRQDPVGPETEDTYGDDFFAGIDGVTNALDNLKARLYMDYRCVFYQKPLLESGTLGTKGNVQVVIPHLTESYGSSADPPEKSIPMCTVKNFPNAIEHCIEWSKENFEELFVKPAQLVNSYLSDPNFVESTTKYSGDAAAQLRTILAYLATDRPITFEQCIAWARHQFEKSYANSIKQLLYSLPKDHVTESGQPFWSGPKRAPEPLVFDSNNPTHLDFIISAANLHAFNYGLRPETEISVFKRVVDSVEVEKFVPKSGVKVQINDSDAVAENKENENVAELTKMLPTPSSMPGYRLVPVEFEKDDDTNFHIDFITAASNLRAINYSIATADRHTTKKVAGKIIPAIATTTSVVTGLVCLELYKVIDGKTKLEEYNNAFLNLALPFFGFSDPIAASKRKYGETEWTLWDRILFEGDPTLQDILDWFQSQHSLELSMVSHGVSMLWSPFVQRKKSEERLKMKTSAVIEQVTKKPLPPYVKQVLIEVIVSDADGEDVEVPSVVVRL